MTKADNINKLKARDVMVSPVTSAECWQTLYEVRRTMLAEGYSALPWRDGDKWRWVTTDWLAKRLLHVDKPLKLNTELQCVPNDKRPNPVDPVDPETEVRSIPRKTCMVVENDAVIGIITPVDLLGSVG